MFTLNFSSLRSQLIWRRRCAHGSWRPPLILFIPIIVIYIRRSLILLLVFIIFLVKVYWARSYHYVLLFAIIYSTIVGPLFKFLVGTLAYFGLSQSWLRLLWVQRCFILPRLFARCFWPLLVWTCLQSLLNFFA